MKPDHMAHSKISDGLTAFAHARKKLGALISKRRNRGGFLPSERILSEKIGVSRVTIKSAVDSYVKDGLLEVRSRRGNYVPQVSPPLTFRVGLVTGAGEMPFVNVGAMAVAAGALEYFSTVPFVGLHQMFLETPQDVFILASQYALDGILWVDPPPESRPIFERLIRSRYPTMAAISSFHRVRLSGNYTGLDHDGKGRARAAHMLGRGCRSIVLSSDGETQGESDTLFRATLERAGVSTRADLFLPDVRTMKERLPVLLERGEIDAVVSDGGDQRLETLFSILEAHPSPSLEILVDHVPWQRLRFCEYAGPGLFLNVMPFREIGATAAERLLQARGKRAWRTEPQLLLPQIIPSMEMYKRPPVNEPPSTGRRDAAKAARSAATTRTSMSVKP